eukprot:Opistho-1_new@70297
MAADLQRPADYQLHGSGDDGRFVVYHVKVTDAFAQALTAAQRKGKDASLEVEFGGAIVGGVFRIKSVDVPEPLSFQFGVSSGAGDGAGEGTAGHGSADCVRYTVRTGDLRVAGRIENKITVKASMTKEFAAKTRAKYDEAENTKRGTSVKVDEPASGPVVVKRPPAMSSPLHVPSSRPASALSPQPPQGPQGAPNRSPQALAATAKSEEAKRLALSKIARLAKGGGSSSLGKAAKAKSETRDGPSAVVVPALEDRTVRLLAVRPLTRTELLRQLQLKGLQVAQLDDVLDKVAEAHGPHFSLVPSAYESLSLQAFPEAERPTVREQATRVFDAAGLSDSAPVRLSFLGKAKAAGAVAADKGSKNVAGKKRRRAASPELSNSSDSSDEDDKARRKRAKKRTKKGEERAKKGKSGKKMSDSGSEDVSFDASKEITSMAEYDRAYEVFGMERKRLQALHDWLENNAREFADIYARLQSLDKNLPEYAKLEKSMNALYAERKPVREKKERQFHRLNEKLRAIKDAVRRYEVERGVADRESP